MTQFAIFKSCESDRQDEQPQSVTVTRALRDDEADFSEVGPMFEIVLPNGTVEHAFLSELSNWDRD